MIIHLIKLDIGSNLKVLGHMQELNNLQGIDLPLTKKLMMFMMIKEMKIFTLTSLVLGLRMLKIAQRWW